MGIGLHFGGGDNWFDIASFVDADYGSISIDRKSVS